MGEEEVGSKFAGDTLMLSEFFAVVCRQRMWRPRAICVNTGGRWRQQGNHGIRYCLRGLARHVSDQRVTGLSLVDRDERLLMTRADDQISLPIAEPFACSNNGWALLDGYLVGEGAAPFATAIAFPPRFLAT